MDRLSFVFSLLLIVSVTTITFGSVIKAKNAIGESLVKARSDPDLFLNMAPRELGALLKRSHHQSNPDMKTDAEAKLQEQNGLEDEESEMFKRDDPATLIPGPNTVTLLEERADENPACGDFQIAICIENLSGHEWRKLSGYQDMGTQPELRDVVLIEERLLASSSGNEERPGVAGVLVYYIEHLDSSLAIMYRVDNKGFIVWGVKLYENETPGNKDMFHDMLDNYAYQATGEDWYPDITLDDSLTCSVRMSTNHRASLEIKISEVIISSM